MACAEELKWFKTNFIVQTLKKYFMLPSSSPDFHLVSGRWVFRPYLSIISDEELTVSITRQCILFLDLAQKLENKGFLGRKMQLVSI